MTIALELQQLKKTYPGGCFVEEDLQVEAGDFYALLGPNGAGKSTTIGIISSLVNKTSGAGQRIWLRSRERCRER